VDKLGVHSAPDGATNQNILRTNDVGLEAKHKMISSKTKPLHVGIAMVLATACTTAALEARPQISWIPTSILMAVPLSHARSTRINAALDQALASAAALRSDLQELLYELSLADSIEDFDQRISRDVTASLTEHLNSMRSIQHRIGISAQKADAVVRELAAARSLSAGLDNMRRQFEVPARPYVSTISHQGMMALSKHARELSLGIA